MVLTTAAGDTAPRRVSRLHDEAGSQALEFALSLPFVVLAITVLLHGGVLAGDVVTAHAVALQAARVAAVADDAAVRKAVDEAAGRRPVEVALSPASGRRSRGDQVVASVRVRSAAFAPFGATVWVPAKVAMRVEAP